MSTISKVTPYIAKAIGLGGTVLIAANAIKDGRCFGHSETNAQMADDLVDTILIHNKSGDTGSLTEHLQKGYFSYLLDSNLINSIRYIKNRVVATFDQIGQSIIPLGLSLGALFTATKSKIPGLKGKIPAPIGKLCAAALVAIGIESIGSKVFGIGKKDDPYLLSEENI